MAANVASSSNNNMRIDSPKHFQMPRGAGSGIVSRIHVEDLAAIVEAGLFSDVQGAWPVADDVPCSSAEIAEPRKLRLEAMNLQAIEGNPLDAEDIAMFEMFEREGWDDERCRAYILERKAAVVAK